MRKVLTYLVALFACVAEILLYSFVCTTMGWERGGGYFLLIVVFSIVSATWTSIISAFDKKEKSSNTIEIESKKNVKVESENKTKTSHETPVSVDAIVNSIEENTSSVAKENKSSNTHEYNKFVKGIIIFMMLSSTLNLFSQLMRNMMIDNVEVGICQFVGGLINLLAFILIYRKNIWGLIVFAIVMFLQIPLNIYWGATDIQSIYISAIFRLIFISLILLIKNKGVTGWRILIENSDFSLFKDFFRKVITVKVSQESINQVMREYNYTPNVYAQHQSSEIREKTTKRSNLLSSYFHFKHLEQILHFTHKEKTSTKDNQNTKKHLIGWVVLFLVVLCLLGLPCSILMQEYPDYVNTFKDKMYYHYGWANEKLCKALIEKGKNAINMNLTELGKEYFLAASDIKCI